MGTTVTPNLGLIKPDIDELIKEQLPTYPGWCSQHAANMDKIDSLFRINTATWTPVWTSAGAAPVLGEYGFLEGKYFRFFPRLVVGFIRLYTGGLGLTVGSGQYSMTLPLPMATELDSMQNEIPIGKGVLHDDNNVAWNTTLTAIYWPPTDRLLFKNTSNDNWGATSPYNLQQQDRMSCYFMYPTSVA